MLCKLMLEHKAALDVEDTERRWPMHLAMQKGHFATARLLADHFNEKKQATQNSCQALEKLVADVQSRAITEAAFLKAVEDLFVEIRYFDTSDTVEKKRELCALLAVYWIVSDQYDLFVRSQKSDACMSKQSWQKLQEWSRGAMRLSENSTTVRTMFVFVAIMSVGKIKSFRAAFSPECQDPGDSLHQVLQKMPFVLPSFLMLDKSAQQMILSSLVAGEFNFGQFLQAENVPASLSVVKDISQGGVLLGFFLFKIFVAMCGILGMKSLEGSLFMTETMFSNFKVGLDVLDNLNSESSGQVYNRFLAARATAQGIDFQADDNECRAIVRLACMLRTFDRPGGEEVVAAFRDLDPAVRKRLIFYLSADGINVRPAFLLFNAPNMLTNARQNKHLNMKLALQMLLHVYETAANEYQGSKVPVVVLMVDELAAATAKCVDADMYLLTAFEIVRAAGVKGDTQGAVALKED